MSHLRILIADDHAVVRAGLKSILDNEMEFSVVAEASSGEEAIEQASIHKPDIVLMDIRMPGGMSGIEACEQILRKLPTTRVVMLTSYAEDELVMDAIRAGAVGYVLKRVDSGKLIDDIRRVMQGEAVIDSAVARTLINEVREAAHIKEASVFADLSERELHILALIAQGLTNREIAQKLYLGEGTVRNYVGKILSSLHVANRAEAAVFAVKNHIERYVALPDEE
ncbi:MAG: response regulator transcription factor [Anaerolineales bacterium]|nr:response regulator transcription factor [Anaerolineales bacterium]